MNERFLTFSIRPGASETRWRGTLADGTRKVDVAAVPEDGKANAELIRFLAEEFGVPKSNVEIVSGERGRVKRVCIKR